MDKQIEEILNDARQKIENAKDIAQLNNLYPVIFGKNAPFANLSKIIPTLPQAEKPKAGQAINALKLELERIYEHARSSLIVNRSSSFIDITAPGKKLKTGHLHLVSQAIEEIVGIFGKLGFSLQSYPEVDWDYYAFESLNMPKNHPARDDWETFFISMHRETSPLFKVDQNTKYGKQVLTPHTSNGQVREMERVKTPPIRMINISRCYRRQIDVSHTPMFHQFEGLLVDKNVSIADLRGTFDFFTTNFFGPKRITRLRPHHFRFTEPSFEVDVTCGVCLGGGCRMCKSGWLELGGAGMVHPNVLKAGNIDSSKYRGFAFGWGIERTIAMKTNLPDIRLLYQNDIRFLNQF